MSNVLSSLFVPKDNFFNDKYAELQNTLGDKFGYDLSFMESLKSTGGKSIPNLPVTIMGVTATVIDFSFLDRALVNIRPWMQSLVYLLLLMFNINNIYKMIRGTSLIDLKMAQVQIHNSINDKE